jgi:hypothetical protein
MSSAACAWSEAASPEGSVDGPAAAALADVLDPAIEDPVVGVD